MDGFILLAGGWLLVAATRAMRDVDYVALLYFDLLFNKNMQMRQLPFRQSFSSVSL